VDSGSLFHSLHHCGIGDFRKFISTAHTVTGPCYDTWRHDMPSFWTDPADIRIRINPDSNPGSHFGLGRVCSLRVLLFVPYVNQFELTAATYFDIDGERHDEQSDHDVGDGQRDDEVVGSGL